MKLRGDTKDHKWYGGDSFGFSLNGEKGSELYNNVLELLNIIRYNENHNYQYIVEMPTNLLPDPNQNMPILEKMKQTGAWMFGIDIPRYTHDFRKTSIHIAFKEKDDALIFKLGE